MSHTYSLTSEKHQLRTFTY